MVKINDILNLNPRTSAPSTPVEGDVYYNSTDKEIKIHNGTIFLSASGEGIIVKDLNAINVDTTSDDNGLTVVGDITVSVAGGVVSNYIKIKSFLSGESIAAISGSSNSGVNSSGESSVGIDILHDTVTTSILGFKEFTKVKNEQIDQAAAGGGDVHVQYSSNCGAFEYYYEPTTDEKADGFDIILKLTATRAGSDFANGRGQIKADYLIIEGL